MDSSVRRALSHALAKALAYKDCGRDDLAQEWGARVVELLADAGPVETDE